MSDAGCENAGLIISQIPLPKTDADRIKYNAVMLDLFDYFGITEEEWLDFLQRKIDAFLEES